MDGHYENLEGKERVIKVHEFFSSIYDKYDLVNKIITFGLDGYWRRKAIGCIPIKNMDILDVGTGTGDMIKRALNKNFVGNVIGVDLTLEMLRLGKYKLNGNKNFTLINANAFYLPFKNERFDVVMAAYTIRNISPIKEVLIEINRVLKKGGMFILLEIGVPQNEILRKLFLMYIFNIVPWIGNVITGNAKAYKYLPSSVVKFPQPTAMISLFNESSFKKVDFISFTLGTSIMYIAYK